MANPAEHRPDLPTRTPFAGPYPGRGDQSPPARRTPEVPAYRLAAEPAPAGEPVRRAEPVPPSRPRPPARWRIPVAAVLTGVLVGGAMWWSQGRTAPASPELAAGPTSVATVRITAPETGGASAGAGIGSDKSASATGLGASTDPVSSPDPTSPAKPATRKPTEKAKPAVKASANPSGRNLALGRRATASSVEGENWAPSFAVDDDPATRWSSGFSDPQWLIVDLGARWEISEITLDWENAHATAYRVDVSADGRTWKQVYSTTNGQSGPMTVQLDQIPGQKVRVYGTERNTDYGYSLVDIDVR